MFAPARITERPVTVEPVNAILFTSGCSASAAPATSPSPGTTLKTPGGIPASTQIRPSSRHVSGASSGALSTTVLPAASAAEPLRQAMWSGKFQGMIMPTTPIGSLRT